MKLVNTYLLVDEVNDKVVSELQLSENLDERPVDIAYRYFQNQLKDGSMKLYVRVKGQDNV